MAEYFYKTENNRVAGPVSGAILKGLCQQGKITPQTRIRKGEGPWVPAGKVEALAPYFTPAARKASATRNPTIESDLLHGLAHQPAARVKEAVDAIREAAATATPSTPPPREEPPRVVFQEAPPEYVGQARPPAGEHVLWKGRPSMLRSSPGRMIVFAMFSLAGVVAILWFHSAMEGLSFLLMGQVFFLRVVAYVLSTEFTVTDQRSTLRTGLLSRSINELRHKDVRQITVNQSILQRMLGTGTIGLSSAAGGGVEISVFGLADPDRIARLVRERQEG